MLDDILAYFISFGVIATGASFRLELDNLRDLDRHRRRLDRGWGDQYFGRGSK
jgi:hypothetical protein